MNSKRLISEGKHWPADYIKTGMNLVKQSNLGKQSWYNDSFIEQDMKTFADEFGPLSHKNSNLGFFSTIVKWFIEYAGTSKEKYQEFIERKLDGIIGTLQVILNDKSYDKVKDEIKTKWTFAQFEELQKKINDEAKASSDKKLKSIKKRDDYDLVPIYSYEELNEKFGGKWTGYKGNSEWCHTNGKSTYDSWTKNGTQMFFVLAQKDWEKINAPNPKTTNAYDEYGLSLIAILVDVATGNLLNETLRWNHVIEPSKTLPGATVDKAFKNSWGELSQTVGMDVKAEVAKQIKGKQDEIKMQQQNVNVEVAKILKNALIITDVTIPKQFRRLIADIKIPDSVESIETAAFAYCASLASIKIPNSVKSIGAYAFYKCTSLTSISIPDSVESIGNYTFSDCTSLTSISIPDSVKSIGNDAFYNCTSLTSISIPDSVKSIGNDAFYNCTSLTSISIPDSVESIEIAAFAYCASLASIKIPNSVKSIGAYAFYNCTSLTSISIPNLVKSIGNHTFSDCKSLKDIIFKGKTIQQVKAMKFYPWGIEDESAIKADNSINESKHDKQIHFWAHMLDDAL